MARKPDFLFNQAGALPFLVDDDGLRVVLITSRTSGRWILPKGVVDPGETPASTAVNESLEEAGVIGEVSGPSLGRFEREKWGGIVRVEVFPLAVREVSDEWDERGSRERVIATLERAKELLAMDIAAIVDAFEASVRG